MNVEHYVYKYISENEIIYVGKVDSDLKRRVEEHAKETKFLPYLENAEIYCMQLANATETTFMELYLINKYKPVLNATAKYEGISNIHVQEPEWIPYNQYLRQKEDVPAEEKLLNIQKEIYFWEQVLFHIGKDMSAGYKIPSTLVLNAKLCPNPVPLGIQADSQEPVSILSFSGILGNTVFCTFRSVSEQTITYLERYLLYLERKENSLKKEIPSKHYY